MYPIAISTGPTAVIGQVTVDSSNSYNCNPGYFVRKKAEKTLLSSIEILCLKNGTLKTDQACLEVCQDFPAVITSCEGYTRLILGEECVPSCRGSLVTRSGDVLKCKKNEEILGDGMMCEENCQNQPPELNLAEVCNLCDLSHAVGVVRVLVNSIEAENKRVALNTAFSVVCADTYRSYFNTYTCDEKIDHDFICIKSRTTFFILQKIFEN